MIERLAKQMVSWQIRKNYLPEEKESLYTYAYELLIGQTVNLLIACLLAAIFRDYITVMVYLAFYIPLRSYAGGHHAATFNVCTMVSAALIGTVCILVKVIPAGGIWLINLAVLFFSGCTVFLLAPVPDANKPLDEQEIIRYRRRSRSIWLLESVLWMICCLAGLREVSLVITLSHLTLTLLLIIGLIKNRRQGYI